MLKIDESKQDLSSQSHTAHNTIRPIKGCDSPVNTLARSVTAHLLLETLFKSCHTRNSSKGKRVLYSASKLESYLSHRNENCRSNFRVEGKAGKYKEGVGGRPHTRCTRDRSGTHATSILLALSDPTTGITSHSASSSGSWWTWAWQYNGNLGPL